MRKFVESIFVWATVAVLCLAVNVTAEDTKETAEPQPTDQFMIGEVAPDFSLMDTKGTEITLEGLRGSYVVIHIAASW